MCADRIHTDTVSTPASETERLESRSSGSKVSESLARELDQAPDDQMVELVLELEESPQPADSGRSRGERIAARKEAFARELEPVASKILQVGGEILGQAWLNQTVKARLPKGAVSEVCDLAEVRRLDAGRPIKPDFSFG